VSVQSYRELVVWQKAMTLVTDIYGITKNWPREEVCGLTNQIRRAAVSVPSNIAEGQGRRSSNEFRNHLSIAYGSLMELETQILIAQQLEYISPTQATELLTTAGEVGRLLNGLRKSLPDHRPPTTDH
jgi:four helix bundle protein